MYSGPIYSLFFSCCRLDPDVNGYGTEFTEMKDAFFIDFEGGAAGTRGAAFGVMLCFDGFLFRVFSASSGGCAFA